MAELDFAKRRLDVHNSDVPMLCRACEVRHKGICGALDPEQLVTLAKSSSKHRLEVGAELVGNGESIDRYSNILSGVVKLTKMLSDGRRQIVGLQFAPDFLGRPFQSESAVAAVAATGVSLCSFPKSALERMMKQSAGLQHHLLEQTLGELDDVRDWMLALGRKSAGEKVASFLLMIARNIDPVDGSDKAPVGFDLPIMRADIADFLGLTIETVSRQLTKLRTAGVIRVANNRHIEIIDMRRLESRSGN